MPLLATDHDGKTAEILWGELSPREHLVQIYNQDSDFLNALEGFVVGGLRVGQAVAVILTGAHLAALEQRLLAAGVDLKLVSLTDQFIAIDADRTLAKLMVRGWPDDILFERVATQLLERAGKGGRRFRVAGEMVALLWNSGHTGATVRLEHLWHHLCQEHGFSVLCAYPRTGFTLDTDLSIRQICAAHSRVVHG